MALRNLGATRLRRAASRRAGFVGLACGLYLAAGILATWPAVRHARTQFLAGAGPPRAGVVPGDYLQTTYRLWLAGHELEHGRAPWRDPYSFRPEARAQANFAGWPFGLLLWPLFAFGPVVAWNLFVLLAYVAAGGLTCAWLRELNLPRGAALAGGLAFAIAPYRVQQSTGHLLGPISLLLPLALLAFERGRRGSWVWLALAAASLASIPLSGQVHLALASTPFFVAYALVRSGARELAAAAAGAAASVAAGYLVWRLSISGSLESEGRTLEEVRHYSAGWLDLVARHARHENERYVFLGWVTPLLAVGGLAALAQARRFGLVLLLGLGAVIPILLALGTNLPLYSALWRAFPPLRYPRVPERLLPVGLVCIAALVAFLAARSRSRVVVPAFLVALLVADLHVRHYGAVSADEGNAAYAALRQESHGRLLELPVFLPGTDLGSVYQYYELQATRERPGGYSTVAPRRADSVARLLRPLNCGRWDGELLQRLGVRYVALHEPLYGPGRWPSRCLAPARRALRRNGWRSLAEDGGITMYRAP